MRLPPFQAGREWSVKMLEVSSIPKAHSADHTYSTLREAQVARLSAALIFLQFCIRTASNFDVPMVRLDLRGT